MDPSAMLRLVQKATPDDTERKNDVLLQGRAEGAYLRRCRPSVQCFNRNGLAVKSYSCTEKYKCEVVMKNYLQTTNQAVCLQMSLRPELVFLAEDRR